jgi:general secretion pathway protein D
MKILTVAGLALLTISFFPNSSVAQSDDAPDLEQQPAMQPNVTELLQDLLAAVEKSSDKTFLVNRHVLAALVTGRAAIDDLGYAELLQILRNNDLAAFTKNGIVSIVPVEIIRMYPLPEYRDRGGALDEEEWVTGVLRVENASAATFIPIMRPMMPQAGHITVNAMSNSVIIVDRLGNARRIFNLIRQLDRTTPDQAE